VRWADLDLLGHVNNVVYVDYLQEARVSLLGVPAGVNVEGRESRPAEDGIVVVAHQIHYLSPLEFDFEPVRIETWATDIRAASFTLAYEIYREREDGREVYVRAATVLAPYVFGAGTPRRLTREEKDRLQRYLEPAETALPEFSEPRPAAGREFDLYTRFSDVDTYGHVNNVKYFEYFQEGRVVALRDLRSGEAAGTEAEPLVVAQADVSYLRPILFSLEPYALDTWVSHVGTRSMVLEGVIRCGETVYARSRHVMVFFDPATGRSREPSPEFRAGLQAMM
jgi:acyl-CoA thioester hydrolase